MSKDLNLIRLALEKNGWFTVIDYLVRRAEDEGKRTLATDLDRAGTDLQAEIESLGGTPDYVR